MGISITHFRQLITEIGANSWWDANFTQRRLEPLTFTYTVDAQGERITEVPKEPFESLLLRVRRLTSSESAENMHAIRKELRRLATNKMDQDLLDVWHKYWRLAFIKEPFLLQANGVGRVLTGYGTYEAFINGQLFHSNIGEYNIVLYGSNQPAPYKRPSLFLQNLFHSVVADLCLAAFGLELYLANGNTFTNVGLTDGVHAVTDFFWYRNRVNELDDQYRIFNEWIEQHGGCYKCRWN